MKHRVWLVLAALVGCGPAYGYLVTTSATVPGDRVVARYALPRAESPRGEIRVVPLSFVDLTTGERALRVRLVVVNDDASPWTVDPRTQQLDLRGAWEPATYAYVDSVAAPSVVTIWPGTNRAIDLYFRVPPNAGFGRTPPPFDVVSSVRTELGTSTERSSFRRVLPQRSVEWY